MADDFILETRDLTREFKGFVAVDTSTCKFVAARSMR